MARVLLVFNAVFGLAPLSVRAASGAASGAVAGGSAPPNDWFAALAETWALSSGSEAQQTVGLERLEQSLLQLAQRSHEEPDNSTLAAINNIGDLIREMIGAVLSTNDAIQHHIRQKKDAMVNCTFRLSRINEAHRSFWMRIHAHRWKHLTCKQEEVAIYTQLEHCEQEKSRCMNTACCAELVQPNKYCLNPGVGPSPLQFQAGCQTTSRCKEESVTSKLSFFKEKIHELDLAEKACEDSRKGCQDYYSCTTQQTVWKMQHSYCNLNQTAFEEAWCHYAAQVEAEFEGFAVCFDHRRTNYLQYETEQKAQLVIRQQEWRALVRIRCFTRAFEHAFQKSGRFEEMSKHPGEVEHCHWPLPQIPAAVSPILMGSWQRAIQ